LGGAKEFSRSGGAKKWGKSKKMETGEWGRGKKGTLARKPLDFEKCPLDPYNYHLNLTQL